METIRNIYVWSVWAALSQGNSFAVMQAIFLQSQSECERDSSHLVSHIEHSSMEQIQ